ncbi:hypothetical protein GWK47_026209 [Chionoecetes opilio]|uniref:Uncharacterized protein n=1 Tax=Chionoecetes opilio TaxID=41210 RepID=A0A8J8WE75_CHIOP|nr:hypothetical protein GWK47_026209 [Chionoecetes opilio]
MWRKNSETEGEYLSVPEDDCETESEYLSAPEDACETEGKYLSAPEDDWNIERELSPYMEEEEVGYEGHIISHDMGDDDDISKQTTKLLVVGNTLQRKFSYCSMEVKLELFRSHCYSIYCNSLWSRFKVAILNRLKVCHNYIIKRLLELPRWFSSSLGFARNGIKSGCDPSTIRVQLKK